MGRADDIFWADFLGVAPDEWETPGLSIRKHAGLTFRGLWSFRRKARTVVSAPAGWVAPLCELVSRLTEPFLAESEWRAVLGDDFERAIGPAFQGCLDPTRYRKLHDENTRFVAQSDPAFTAFRSECPPDDWQLDKVEGTIAVRFVGSKVVAGFARRVGYERYANHLAVRLRRDTREIQP